MRKENLMAKTKETRSKTRRTKVKDLPKQKRELSKEEQKKVKGGGWLMTPAGHAKPQGT